MSDTIISVENLSKCYRIGTREQGYKTFRAAIIDGFKAPIRNFQRLRKLTKFDTNQQTPSSVNREQITDNTSQNDVIWALKDLSFEIKQGEAVGVIGKNGSGKTTLLKILSRITEPTNGDVKIYGRVASLLEVGTGFHPELTGRENIFLNGAILGMSKADIKRRFDEIVAFSEIEKFLDTPVKRYSSGMYVRLAFAVASHLETDILLVDEVLAVGDIAFQKKCMGRMSEIGEHGKTVIFVSHNIGAISTLCESGLLLSGGKGQHYSSISDCISEYMIELYEKSEETISLSDRKRPKVFGLREGAKFISAEMVSEEKQAAWEIPFPNPPAFKFDIEVYKTVPNLELGMALYNQAYVEISSSLSTDDLTINSIQPGTYQMTAKYRDFKLLPGRYSLALGLRSDLGMEDYIPDALHFEILTSKEAGESKAHTRRGVIIPKISFEITGDNMVDFKYKALH